MEAERLKNGAEMQKVEKQNGDELVLCPSP